jgi:hypothetical protein
MDAPLLRSTPEEPSAYQLQLIRDAALLRGAIITSYAQVEFLLADFAIRCRARAVYASVCPKFPYKLEDRIKATRRIIRTPGPFSVYADKVEALCAGLLQFEEMRHFMAHGFQIIRNNKSGTQHDLTYRLHRPVGKHGEAEERFIVTDLDQLDHAAKAIGDYAQSFVLLWRTMYIEQGLEPAA